MVLLGTRMRAAYASTLLRNTRLKQRHFKAPERLWFGLELGRVHEVLVAGAG
jgi:hypothetical protein